MKKLSFRGGLHVYDGKDLSKDKKIKTILPKGDMVYPLSQHIGAMANAIVEEGDRVLVGQKIAEAQGTVSAPIHASVSGIVKAIEPRCVATGEQLQSIVIENDHLFEEVSYQIPSPYHTMEREEIVRCIKEAGIVGMGGAGFPTHVKVSPEDPSAIEYVIINCAECEPYLTSDYRRMMEDPEKIREGLLILLHIFPNAKGIIAIEDNKRDCVKLLEKVTKEDAQIEVKSLETKYPQGSEHQLIYATTKRAIDSSKLPSDVNCIVQNADTVVAIANALCEGRPLIERIVTVTGDAVVESCNLRVRIGTGYQELIDAAGGFVKEPSKMISGGPMMGVSLIHLEVPTTKISSALLCLCEDDVSKKKQSACFNCGKCVSVCPSRLVPTFLEKCANHYEEEKFIAMHGMECVNCGCCSYVCPAKRSLAQSISAMRKEQLAKRK